jgi:hypothetical protein
MEVTDKIRKALPQDLPEIGSALSHAFFDDPLFGWARLLTWPCHALPA